MDNDRLEEITLVNDSFYLRMRENENGFEYIVIDRKSYVKLHDGQVQWSELEDSLIRNALVASRWYVLEDIGVEVKKSCFVNASVLENVVD